MMSRIHIDFYRVSLCVCIARANTGTSNNSNNNKPELIGLQSDCCSFARLRLWIKISWKSTLNYYLFFFTATGVCMYVCLHVFSVFVYVSLLEFLWSFAYIVKNVLKITVCLSKEIRGKIEWKYIMPNVGAYWRQIVQWNLSLEFYNKMLCIYLHE